MILAVIPLRLILAGCASTPQPAGPDQLSSEKRQEAEDIEAAEADGSLSPIEADLQKDALQHNIKF